MSFEQPTVSTNSLVLKRYSLLALARSAETMLKSIGLAILFVNVAISLILGVYLAVITITATLLLLAYFFLFILFLSFYISHINGIVMFLGGLGVAYVLKHWNKPITRWRKKTILKVKSFTNYPWHMALYRFSMHPSRLILRHIIQTNRKLQLQLLGE